MALVERAYPGIEGKHPPPSVESGLALHVLPQSMTRSVKTSTPRIFCAYSIS